MQRDATCAIKLLLHTRGTMAAQAVSFASPRVARAPPGFHVWKRFVEESRMEVWRWRINPTGLEITHPGERCIGPTGVDRVTYKARENVECISRGASQHCISSYLAICVLLPELFLFHTNPCKYTWEPNPSKSHVNGLEPSTSAARSLVRQRP